MRQTLLVTPAALAALVAAVALLAFIGWPASVYRVGASDMWQFWQAPRALLDGRAPYEIWPWPYPLWTAVVLLPLGLVPLELAAPIWLVAQVALVAAVLALVARRVLVTSYRRDAVVLLGIALAFEPLWLLVGGGNMTGLLFAGFGAALLARLDERPFLSGSLAGLLVLKPVAFLVSAPVLLLSRARGRWSALLGGALVTSVLAAASFALHPGWPGAWVNSATALQTSQGSNATGWTVGRQLPGPDLVSPVTLALAVLVFALWWRRRRPGPLLLVAASIPVSVYVAPHGWSYDQLHLLITYAVVLELLARLPSSERTLGLVALAVFAIVLPWALYARAVFTGTEDPSAIVPLLAFGLLVTADRRASRYPSSASPEAPV